MIYSRNCPSCNKEIIHKTEKARYLAEWRNSVCRSCSQKGHKVSEESKEKMSKAKIGKPTWASLHKEEFGKMICGENHPFFGKHHTEEMRRKQSERYSGRTLSDETKEKLSEASRNCWKDPVKRGKMIHKCRWNNVALDKGQLELLEKWNRLGFHFEPNYQLKAKDCLYYLDGYDKDKNVVLEYDSPYHNREFQKVKDLKRQKKIVEILKPKRFWRYNKKYNTFRCIF